MQNGQSRYFPPASHILKSDKLLVKVHTPEGDIETGIKKFGAMIGDEVEVGCGSVLNPGTVCFSYSSSLKEAPSSRIKAPISGNASQG